MKKTAFSNVICIAVSSLALGLWSQPVCAQHGGFHGGGIHGGGGFHGPVGPYHHGAGHFQGGYYGGWHGGYWGNPYYGYGWGFGISFGWWPYYPYGRWWGVPYYYYPYPYPYPYYGICSPSASSSHDQCRPPGSSSDDYRVNSAPTRPRVSGHRESPDDNSAPPPDEDSTPPLDTNSVTTNFADAAPPVGSAGARAVSFTAIYRPTDSSSPELSLRRQVRNVFEALRAMPPEARQRFIDSGRCRNLSPQERELLIRFSESTLASKLPRPVPSQPQ